MLKHKDAGVFEGTETKELADFIGRIVIPDFLGKTNWSYKWKKYVELLYKCIYKFNFKSAYSLYASQVMQKIFEFVLKGESFEIMLNEDSNLTKNKELWRQKAKEILQGFAEKIESDQEKSSQEWTPL